MESNGKIVICDMEAGVGPVVRAGHADLVLVVAEPMAKSIEVARRAAEVASGDARVIVIANRLQRPGDLEAIRSVLGDYEYVAVPDEPGIARADRDGVAPIDAEPESPGVRALVDLADRLGNEAAAVA